MLFAGIDRSLAKTISEASGAIGLVAYLFKKAKGDDKPKSDGPNTGKRNW